MASSNFHEIAPERTSAGEPTIDTAQVLFCDLQKKIVEHSKTTSPRSLSSAVGALLQLAELFTLPTITSVVPEGKELIDELRQNIDRPPIPRVTASLFGDSPTESAIAQSGRKALIVAGFMIEGVVLSTVLDGRSRGYEVLVPVDACGSVSGRTELAAFRQMEAAGAVTTSVIAIGASLEPDFSTARGQKMFKIVQSIHFD